MARFRYFMDFGYGMTAINIFNNNLSHVIKRTVSEFTCRSSLDGSFAMEISNFADITTLVLDGAYVNAIAGDIGKQVEDDASPVGVLLGYDNAIKTWWIRTSSTIADNSVMTIASGTGAGDAAGAGVHSSLPDFVETSEVIGFKIEEDQNRSGSPSWIEIFNGTAHLRGNIDWVKGFIEIFGFSQLTGKLEEFLTIWEQNTKFTINSEDNGMQITDGTTTYDIGDIGARLVFHIEGDISTRGMSEITLVGESLPFDSDKLQIFPNRIFDARINFSPGSAIQEKFTIKEQLQILQDLFQSYWYIDETIPATSKMIFFRPDDTPVSRLVLDGTYTNCVASDIGKQVEDDTVSVGELLDFDNTNQVWWIRATSVIADNSVMTIATGTGSGDASGASDNSLFFTQPQINIETDAVNLRRDKYLDPEMVYLENFNFLNENNQVDFVGFPLRYSNVTEKQITYDIKSTTNVFDAAAAANGGQSSETLTGLSVVWVTDIGGNEFTTDTGTGLISSTTISNEFLSKARLHDSWFKTNRFHIRSGVFINDSFETLADDAVEKHIRNFPDYKTVLSAVPSTIGTLRWEFDSPNELIGLITKASTSLNTGITIYESRQFKSWLT